MLKGIQPHDGKGGQIKIVSDSSSPPPGEQWVIGRALVIRCVRGQVSRNNGREQSRGAAESDLCTSLTFLRLVCLQRPSLFVFASLQRKSWKRKSSIPEPSNPSSEPS